MISLSLPPPQNEPLKTPSRLGLINFQVIDVSLAWSHFGVTFPQNIILYFDTVIRLEIELKMNVHKIDLQEDVILVLFKECY